MIGRLSFRSRSRIRKSREMMMKKKIFQIFLLN